MPAAPKVQRLYGFRFDCDRRANPIELQRAEATIRQAVEHLLAFQGYNVNEYKVYLHSFSVRASQNTFRGLPLSERVASLNVELRLPKRLVSRGQIRFLNHLCGLKDTQPWYAALNPYESEGLIEFTLPGAALEPGRPHRLHVATFVHRSLALPDRRFTLAITPEPTPRFRSRLHREFGDPTKLPRRIDGAVQLQLFDDVLPVRAPAPASQPEPARSIRLADLLMSMFQPSEFQLALRNDADLQGVLSELSPMGDRSPAEWFASIVDAVERRGMTSKLLTLVGEARPRRRLEIDALVPQ